MAALAIETHKAIAEIDSTIRPFISKEGAVPKSIDPNVKPKDWIKDAPQPLPEYQEDDRRFWFLEQFKPLTIFDPSWWHAYFSDRDDSDQGRPTLPSAKHPPNRPGRNNLGIPAKVAQLPSLDSIDDDWIHCLLDEIPDPVPGTCQWFFSQDKCVRWRNAQAPPERVLLLVGDLASGKTVLAKSLFGRPDCGPVLPFFFRSDVLRRDTVHAALATFCYFLLSKNKVLTKHINDFRSSNVRSLSLVDMWTLFCDLADDESTSERTFIFDGLDECTDESQKALQNIFAQGLWPKRAKILLTSRSTAHAARLDHFCPSIKIDKALLSHDVEVVLKYEIERRRLASQFSTDILQLITEDMHQLVQGVFLLINAKLDELEAAIAAPEFETSPSFLHGFFRRPPEFLNDYFESELQQRVSSQSAADQTVQILNILLACQQEAIGEVEMRTAMLFSESSPPNFESVFDSEAHPDCLDVIRRTCGPLIRITSGWNAKTKIVFSHPTVKAYLTGPINAPLKDPFSQFRERVSVTEGHILLAEACLKFLGLVDEWPEERAHITTHPFYSYSLQHWTYHVRECQDHFIAHADSLVKFWNGESSAYKMWSAYRRRSVNDFGTIPEWWEKPVPVVDTLVKQKLTKILMSAVASEEPGHATLFGILDINIDEPDSRGRSALHAAIADSQIGSAHALLKLGASVHQPDRSSLTPLHLAVKLQNAALVTELLDRGADPTAQTSQNFSQSPLMMSVAGNSRIFMLLINRSADGFVRPEDDWSILHEILERDDTEKLKLFLPLKHVDVNLAAKNGKTPLIVAAGSCKMSFAVDRLLQLGADIDVPTTRGSTALSAAAFNGRIPNVIALLRAGARTDLGRDGRTPLINAVFRGHEEIVRRLLNARVDVNFQDPDGDTALMVGARQSRNNSSSILQLLLRHGADLETKNKRGQRAILIASYSARAASISVLLYRYPDRAAAARIHNETWSCLHAAAYSGKVENVRCLLEARGPLSDIDEVYDLEGWTPLMCALVPGHDAVAQHLIRFGASPTMASKNRWTALHMACFYSKNAELLADVIKKSPPSSLMAATEDGSTPLSLAAEKGFVNGVKALLKIPTVNPILCDRFGCTPLYYACSSGSSEAAKVLLSVNHLADVRSHLGLTALHAACQKCDKAVVAQLAKETDWQCQYRLGATPLQIAIENGNDDAFSALLEQGLPVDLRSGWGSTPLFQAAGAGRVRHVQSLKERGADLDAMNWANRVPLHGAYNIKSVELAQMLRPSEKLKLRQTTTTLDSIIHYAACLSLSEFEWATKRFKKSFPRNVLHETPLSKACENGRDDVVRRLLEDEDIHLQTTARTFLTGWTPLHIAARFRHARCISAIASNGFVDPYAEDFCGMTAFDYARGDVPSWLALTEWYPFLQNDQSPRIVKPLNEHKYASGLQAEGVSAASPKWIELRPFEHTMSPVDVYQICNLIEYRLKQLGNGNESQFDEADGSIIAQALVDVFFRLDDYSNALIATEMYLGKPSFKLNPGIQCHYCRRTKNSKIYVCDTCPFRILCPQCKDKSQRVNLRGCYRHEMIEAPSESWYSRDPGQVNAAGQTEQQWLSTILPVFESQRDQEYDASHLTLVVEDHMCDATDIFNKYLGPDVAHFLEHLRKHPRDVGVKDAQGRTIVMKVLETANDDKKCFQKLSKLATVGAKMLVTDKSQTSSICLALDKRHGFEKTISFLLEHWDIEFDRTPDPCSSRAIQAMIDNQWQTALAFAIQRHFEWAAQGSFYFLRGLLEMGVTKEEITERLLLNRSGKVTSRATSSDGGWDLASSDIDDSEPFIHGHAHGCVHLSINEQVTAHMKDAASSVSTMERKRMVFVNELVAMERTLSSGNASVMSTSSALERVQSSSESSIDDHLQTVKSTRQAITLCGIGGISVLDPSHIKLIDTDGEPSRAIVSYSAHGGSSAGEEAKNEKEKEEGGALQRLQQIAKRFSQAVVKAQEAKLCCDSFTLLKRSEKRSGDGKSVICMVSLRLETVIPLVSELQSLERRPENIEFARELSEEILQNALGGSEIGSLLKEERSLHVCSLALQLLTLGFAFFLLGHRASAQMPLLKDHCSEYELRGNGGTYHIRVRPAKMACVGDMLEDDIFVFSLADGVSGGEASDKAYLSASAEKMLEIWGPFLCIGEKTRSGQPTGRLLAIQFGSGQLSLVDKEDESRQVAHWSPEWKEMDNLKSFSLSEELLVGTLPQNDFCPFNTDQAWNEARASSELTELQTRPEYWLIKQRQIQVGFQQYATLIGTVVWEHARGKALKEVVMSQFELLAGDVHCLNRPLGVLLSLCTGHAERVPLREAVATVLDQYLSTVSFHEDKPFGLGQAQMQQTQRTLHEKLKGAGLSVEEDNQAFLDYYRDAGETLPYIRAVILYVLLHLRQTGYREESSKFRVAWAYSEQPALCIEFNCRGRDNLRWLRLMKDTSKVATFAAATNKCLLAHPQELKRASEDPHPGSCRGYSLNTTTPPPFGLHLLHTRIFVPSCLSTKNVYVFKLENGKSVPCRYKVTPLDNGHIVNFLIVIQGSDWMPQSLQKLGNALSGDNIEYVQEYVNLDPVTKPLRRKQHHIHISTMPKLERLMSDLSAMRAAEPNNFDSPVRARSGTI